MGKVYLVGAGPGDPELLTLKAARLLEQAQVVIYDRLVPAGIVAYANPKAKFIYAGKEPGRQEEIQRDVFAALTEHAAEPGIVVRLKGGDPMVFGRGGEEWRHLAELGIDVEVVPGVSAAIAVPALAGIPLTYRGIAASFAVIAGHRQNLQRLDWSPYRGIDTLVVLMGVEFRDIIATTLIELGRPASEPVAFIERGSTDRERVVVTTLGEVSRRLVAVSAPAVCVIGEVVRLRAALVTETKSTEAAIAR
jgi:uroporphyrin-III C-methyltransferase